MRAFSVVLSILALSTAAWAFDATNPAADGYSLVFNSDFSVDTISTVDVNNTGAPGYKWYVRKWPFASGSIAGPSNFSVSGGALTIIPPAGDTTNYQLGTAIPGGIGRVFSQGWYVEASIQFNTADVLNGVAFWSENITWAACPAGGCMGRQWPGQVVPYDHWVEDDIFEWWNAVTVNNYAGSVIDWYGSRSHSQVDNRAVSIQNVGTVNYGLFHKYGQLWIPGNAANGFHGSLTFYYDGSPTADIVSWVDPTPSMMTSFPAPPPSGANIFAWMDTQSMILILGGQGPFKVGYVNVWQKPNSN